MDAALSTIRDQPFGAVLLAIMAAGIACFGVYCFFWARWPLLSPGSSSAGVRLCTPYCASNWRRNLGGALISHESVISSRTRPVDLVQIHQHNRRSLVMRRGEERIRARSQ